MVNDFSGSEATLQRAEVSAKVRSLQELANIPTDYEPLTIAEHRAVFERFKSEQPR